MERCDCAGRWEPQRHAANARGADGASRKISRGGVSPSSLAQQICGGGAVRARWAREVEECKEETSPIHRMRRQTSQMTRRAPLAMPLRHALEAAALQHDGAHRIQNAGHITHTYPRRRQVTTRESV